MVDKQELSKVPRDTNFYSNFADYTIDYLQNNDDTKYQEEFNYIIRVWKNGING